MTDTTERPAQAHYSIRYLSRYRYAAEVADNMNALRVRPASNGRQQVEDFSVRLTPDVRQYGYADYFGTEVVEFEVTRPHHELVIDAHGHVTTEAQRQPPSSSWEELLSPAYREAGAEYLAQTDDAAGHPLLERLQAEMAATSTPLEAVRLASRLVPDSLEYRKGATFVDSGLRDVLDIGAGVCQDFVHVTLNILRRQGIAARYVSGYLYATGHDSATPSTAEPVTSGPVTSGPVTPGPVTPGPVTPGPDEEAAASVEVDTHAWLEALLPSPLGEAVWVGIDPTNRDLADERHVKIGHGRHYADVPPIKGVYRGASASALEARVTMRRVEPITRPPRRGAA